MNIIIRMLIGLSVLAPLARAHESPVDHVEREFRLNVVDGLFRVSYRVGLTERAALLQLRAVDTNGDGQVSDEEAAVFFTAQAKMFADLVELEVNGQRLPLTPAEPVALDAKFGQTYIFTAPLGALAQGAHPGRLIDGYSRLYPGSYRWVEPGVGVTNDVRVEPRNVLANQSAGLNEHPAWIELPFNVIVP